MRFLRFSLSWLRIFLNSSEYFFELIIKVFFSRGSLSTSSNRISSIFNATYFSRPSRISLDPMKNCNNLLPVFIPKISMNCNTNYLGGIFSFSTSRNILLSFSSSWQKRRHFFRNVSKVNAGKFTIL